MKLKRSDTEYNKATCKSMLGRELFLRNVCEELLNSKDSLNIALSGSWGIGKTFFVNKLKEDMEEHNESQGIGKFRCIYINAWENDYFETPLLAFLDCLLFLPDFSDLFDHSSIFEDLSLDLEFGLSMVVSASAKVNSKKRHLLSRIKYSKFLKESVCDLLIKYIKKNSIERLYVFVDELDRCRPDFSVQLLEQYKHLNERTELKIIFIYVLDQKQLSASLKSIYGSEFDTINYLQKIFDYFIYFPNLSQELVFEYMVRNLKIAPSWIKSALNSCYDRCDLSLRDINRIAPYLLRIKAYGKVNLRNLGPEDDYLIVLFFIAVIRTKDPLLLRDITISQSNLDLILEKIIQITNEGTGFYNFKTPAAKKELVEIIDYLFGSRGQSRNIINEIFYDFDEK